MGNNLAAATAVSCAYSSREWGIYWADSMAGVSQREAGREVSLCFDGVVKHRERWMDGALKMSEDGGGGERDPSKTVTFGASFLKDE